MDSSQNSPSGVDEAGGALRRMSGRPAGVHVAIVTSNFWPEPTGTSQTVWEFARFLADAGVVVKVATSMPYYPEWRIWPAYRGRLWSSETHGGVMIRRSWHYVSPRPTTLTRLVHELTLSAVALPNLIRTLWKASEAYVVSPALSYAFVGVVVAKLCGVRTVLVVKDVMPDAAVELGMLRNRLMIAVSRFLARRAYSWADEIHTLGEGMRSRIASQTVRGAKIRVVPDTIDASELAPVPTGANEFRKRFAPDGSFVVLHTGNMGKKQDLHLLLRAAKRLRGDRRVRFVVVGDGAAKDEFLRVRLEWDLQNVHHYPLQDRWMLPHMLSGADLVVVSQLPEVIDIVVPSKLITAFGAGAMILAACPEQSETARLIRESDGGIVVAASDDEALVREIGKIRGGQVDVAGYRSRARRFALVRFDRRAVYEPLARSHLAGSREAELEASFSGGPETRNLEA